MLLRRFVKSFSTLSAKITDVPKVDLQKFLDSGADNNACKDVAKGFYETGCLIIRDPRTKSSDNAKFMEMMVKYFDSRSKVFYKGGKLEECYPEDGYQHGVTPENIEVARLHDNLMKSYSKDHKPYSPLKPQPDKKWRFFWRTGATTGKEAERQFDSKRIIPKDFPGWEGIMDNYGQVLVKACETVSEMLAIGLDLPAKTFVQNMQGAPQLLAPTGSDLNKNHKKGDILAGFHYDLNFITIHGKSNYPGLYVWLRDGRKIPVKVPDGCLLLQSGKQLEHFTGGYVKAGFHEVVVDDACLKAIEDAKAQNKPLWRVSSTLFSSMRYDVTLEPLAQYSTAESRTKYPKISAYEHTLDELKHINLVK